VRLPQATPSKAITRQNRTSFSFPAINSEEIKYKFKHLLPVQEFYCSFNSTTTKHPTDKEKQQKQRFHRQRKGFAALQPTSSAKMML
jgi:hypothetical protein